MAVAVVMLGVSALVALGGSYRQLAASRDAFYARYRIADITVNTLVGSHDARDLANGIPGVERTAARLVLPLSANVGEARLMLEVRTFEPEADSLNALHLYEGSGLLESGIYVERNFARHHGLEVGDSVELLPDSEVVRLTVSGIVGSPDVVYTMRTIQDIAPPLDGFGVAYVGEATARRIAGELPEGASARSVLVGPEYNQILLAVDNGVRVSEVAEDAEEHLSSLRPTRVIKNRDLLSDIVLRNNIDQIGAVAAVFPMMFVVVALMLIYVLIARLVEAQRRELGVLLALGVGHAPLMLSFMAIPVLIGGLGAVAGVLLGERLATLAVSFYASYFNMPVMGGVQSVGTPWLAIMLILVTCLFAGALPVRHMLAVQVPIDLLRPHTPTASKETDTLGGVVRRLPVRWRISARSLLRNHRRSRPVVLGSVASIVLIVCSVFILDGMDYLMRAHFSEFNRQDVTVVFTEMQEIGAGLLSDEPHVARAEPILELPVRVTSTQGSQTVVGTGVSPGAHLLDLGDRLPGPGEVIVSERLAEELFLTPGDWVTVDVAGNTSEFRVVARVTQLVGTGAYFPIESLSELADIPPSATKALLETSGADIASLRTSLMTNPAIGTVELREEQRDLFRNTYMGALYVFVGMAAFFAFTMGFLVVFGTTSIDLIERAADFVILKTIGYSAGEIARQMTIENLVLSVESMLMGMPLAVLMAWQLSGVFGTDILSMPFVIYPRTMVIAAGASVAFTVLAQARNGWEIEQQGMTGQLAE